MDDYGQLSFREVIIRFFKNSSIYGFFIFIIRFGGFFLTPIYWHFLSPKDYGILGLISVLSGVLAPIIIMGINGSVERFYYEWTDEERQKKIGALWLLSVLIALSLVLIIETTSRHVFPVLFKQVSYNPYLRIGLYTTFFGSFAFIPFRILRITERTKMFGVISLISFILSSTITILLLSVIEKKIMGFLYGGLISSGLIAIFWMGWMFKRVKLNLNILSIKQEVFYALPNLPINIIESLHRNWDRYLLEKYLSLRQLGYYNIGNSLGIYYDQINSVFKTAWFPVIYKMFFQRKDFRKILPELSVFYFFVMTVFALSASLLTKEIIFWFAKDKFMGAYQYVPLFVLIYLIKHFGTAWGNGLDLIKKPYFALLSNIPGCSIAILLLYLWIPKYGAYGALLSLLVSSGVRVGIYVVMAHIAYPRKFLINKVVPLVLLLLISFYLGYGIDVQSTVFCFSLKGILILLYTGLGSGVVFGFGRLFKEAQFKAVVLKRKAFG